MTRPVNCRNCGGKAKLDKCNSGKGIVAYVYCLKCSNSGPARFGEKNPKPSELSCKSAENAAVVAWNMQNS